MEDPCVEQLLDLDSHLSKVQEELHGSDSKWKAIGIQLKIPISTLDKIESEHKSLEACNQNMQIAWLKTGQATWKKLVEALKINCVGLKVKAESIERKYVQAQGQLRLTGNVCRNSAEFSDDREKPKSRCCEERLDEMMEWLLKMGFDLDDIEKWVREKKEPPATSQATPPSRLLSKNGNSSTTRTKRNETHKKRRHASQNKQPRSKRARSAPEEFETSESRERGCLTDNTSTRRTSTDERQGRKSMEGNMMMILDILLEEESAEEFIDEVDIERADDYNDYIKKPMHLKKMKKKVKDGKYDSSKMFCDDFNLIIENCHEYNGPDSEYMKQADQLESKFHELRSLYLPSNIEYSHLERLRSPDAESSKDVESSDAEISDAESSENHEESQCAGVETENLEGGSDSERCEENSQSLDTSDSTEIVESDDMDTTYDDDNDTTFERDSQP